MLSAYEQERRWRRSGGELHVHIDAGGGGGCIYKSTAGVMEQHPDAYALTLVIVFQDVAFAPAPPVDLSAIANMTSLRGFIKTGFTRRLGRESWQTSDDSVTAATFAHFFCVFFCGSFDGIMTPLWCQM